MNDVMNYGDSNPFKIFDYKNLGSVRTYLDERNEPWFCLKDVCSILGLNHVATVSERLNPKGVVINHTLTNGGPQGIVFVEEIELYKLIFTSRKTEAEDLKRWVFNEVLPSLRKNGYYSLEDDDSLSLTTKAIISHDRRIKLLETNYTKMGGKIEHLETEVERHNIRQDELENRQVALLEEGYHAILRFAKYYGINTTERDRQILGKKATAICNQRGIPMGQEPAGRLIANTYPYPVLVEVFQDFVSSNNN